jgi:hypothetical protein
LRTFVETDNEQMVRNGIKDILTSNSVSADIVAAMADLRITTLDWG